MQLRRQALRTTGTRTVEHPGHSASSPTAHWAVRAGAMSHPGRSTDQPAADFADLPSLPVEPTLGSRAPSFTLHPSGKGMEGSSKEEVPCPGPRSWRLTAPASPVRGSHALPPLLAPRHFRLLGEDSGAGQAAAFSAVGSITYSTSIHCSPFGSSPPPRPPDARAWPGGGVLNANCHPGFCG